jgi:hypothetical protein
MPFARKANTGESPQSNGALEIPKASIKRIMKLNDEVGSVSTVH